MVDIKVAFDPFTREIFPLCLSRWKLSSLVCAVQWLDFSIFGLFWRSDLYHICPFAWISIDFFSIKLFLKIVIPVITGLFKILYLAESKSFYFLCSEYPPLFHMEFVSAFSENSWAFFSSFHLFFVM